MGDPRWDCRKWAHETPGGKGARYRSLPEQKEEAAPAHGPGGLLATPGMGRRKAAPKWRTKAANYGARAGETIAGNLRRGNDGKFSSAGGPAATPKRGVQYSKPTKLSTPAAPKRAAGRGGKKAGGKGRAAAKPKQTPEQRHAAATAAHQQKLAENRQKVIDAMAQGDVGLAPNIAKAMLDFADGKPLDGAIAKGLVGAGLIEMGKDGQPHLSQAGRMAATAMNRGDVRGALDAIGRGADRAGATAEKKPKGGGGGGKAKKPTPAKPTLSPALVSATQRLSQGAQLSTADGDALVRNGLARRDRDGKLILTSAGLRASQQAQQKSFTVFKDVRGRHRWILRTSTAFRDRDDEIVTTKAQEDDAARMRTTGQYGPLRYWHVGEPDPFDPIAPWGPGLDLGMCDYSMVIGRTRVESGTFYSDAIGQAIAEKADDYEGSPGFFHAFDQPDTGKHFWAIRGFERSLVPLAFARASNLFTGLAIGKATKSMDQTEYNRRVQAFLADMQGKGVAPEIAADVIVQQQQAEKTADEQQIAYKSDDAPVVLTTPDGTQGIIQDGRFVALKAFPPPADAEDDPALGGDSGADEAAEGEPPLDAGMGDEGATDENVVGNMSPDEFSALLTQAFTTALQPLAGLLDIEKKMAAHVDSVMGGYKTKDDARSQEIATLKARLAQLEGDQPAIQQPPTSAEGDVALALKGAPAEAADPTAPQIPDDPNRPWAALGALVNPTLYGAQPAGYGPNGWHINLPQSDTGGS